MFEWVKERERVSVKKRELVGLSAKGRKPFDRKTQALNYLPR